jgi:hypothetical protein
MLLSRYQKVNRPSFSLAIGHATTLEIRAMRDT